MASFCVAMGGWTPDMYYALTLAERAAYIEALNRRR